MLKKLLFIVVAIVLLPFHIVRAAYYVLSGHRRCWMCETYRDVYGKPEPDCPGCNGSGFKKEA